MYVALGADALAQEDMFEMVGQPMFGYKRGRYTLDELREIDQRAAAFGLEVIPCIQTLGHLEQVRILNRSGELPLQNGKLLRFCNSRLPVFHTGWAHFLRPCSDLSDDH